MGFCRRCGDIVTGMKCKCGGAAVAPVVQWNQGTTKGPSTDKWLQTYVARETSPTGAAARAATSSTQAVSDTNRFPRPKSSLGSRVSAHIALTTTSRPPSPLKQSSTSSPPSPAADVIASPYTSELSKVYGSILQPEQSLATFHCYVCSATFPPDATIYPDPADSSGTHFMCRACFSENGGSKGDCQDCHRSVLILKSEGGFVENAGRVWHKKCFRCAGCGKSVGDNPMVDLLGQPSCADCFGTCLRRNESPRHRSSPAQPHRDDASNLGGFRSRRKSREGSPTIEELEHVIGVRSRESTLTKSETPRRSNPPSKDHGSIERSTATSPLVPRQPATAMRTGGGSPAPSHPQRRIEVTDEGSPRRRTYDRSKPLEGSPRSSLPMIGGESPRPSVQAIEEMKNRLLRQASSPSLGKNTNSPSSNSSTPKATPRATVHHSNTPPESSSPRTDSHNLKGPSSSRRLSDRPLLRNRESNSSLRTEAESTFSMSSLPSTPSLVSDFSDATTQSSGPSSPPSYSPPSRDDDIFSSSGRSMRSEFTDSYRIPTNFAEEKARPAVSLEPNARCAKCNMSLFNTKGRGRYVTVPEPSAAGTPPKTYHTDCFRCRICDGTFEERERGQAVFVRGVRGACHLNCAPPEKTTIRHITTTSFPSPNAVITRNEAPKKASKATSSSSPSSSYSSSRYTAPLQSAPATTTTFPRFGGSTCCAGCHKPVSPMERGVVPGPQGTRWHAACLICGGKEAKGRGGRRRNGQPGCGKSLDSSAKRGADEGVVWCKECLLLLPPSLRSPQTSPTRVSPLKPVLTGTSTSSSTSGQFGRIAPQHTGTTTIARQFTGMSGGVDAALARQITGGGLSPTRQLTGSPTKSISRQFTGGSSQGTIRPRPKSVIGMRDEGRGMFLIRQMTGGGGA
ncbi:hypothetical protein BV25DRAFT_1793553 [Artomyces pyxidatus]|uniref:Uncharacterized protein n=1 Tax=Artomyces pyxidatus TaxID=48021 RepID=A0ACB8TJ72_9AGAM|nr:hypothetical protein BV25DRAFT_1793553 [Artomyces pyxidatus]